MSASLPTSRPGCSGSSRPMRGAWRSGIGDPDLSSQAAIKPNGSRTSRITGRSADTSTSTPCEPTWSPALRIGPGPASRATSIPPGAGLGRLRPLVPGLAWGVRGGCLRCDRRTRPLRRHGNRATARIPVRRVEARWDTEVGFLRLPAEGSIAPGTDPSGHAGNQGVVE
jgi:hypothetical protein